MTQKVMLRCMSGDMAEKVDMGLMVLVSMMQIMGMMIAMGYLVVMERVMNQMMIDKALQQSCEDLRKNNKNMKKEIKKLKKKNKFQEEDIKRLEERKYFNEEKKIGKKEISEISSLKQKINSLNQQNNSLKQNNKALNKKVNAFQEESTSFSQKINSLKIENRTLVDKMEDLYIKIHSLSQESDREKQRIISYKNTINQLKSNSNATSTATFQKTIQNLKNTVNSHKEAINELNQKVKNQSNTLTQQISKITAYKEESKIIKKEREQEKKKLEKADKYLIDLKGQSSKIELLKSCLRDDFNKIQELKRLLSIEKSKAKEAQVIAATNYELLQNQGLILDLSQDLSKALEENQALKSLFDQNDSPKNSSLKSLITKLQLKISALEKLSTNPPSSPTSLSLQSLQTQIAKIKSYLECPIYFDEIQSPVICPSGHTIDQKTYKELFKNKMSDPFSGEKLNKKVIVNRFMVAVKEILQSENAQNHEEEKEDTKKSE
ncbi:unnamed protein product [Moneuplotes crassus]|uniref:U-box domain-containing protein n=1 Tax=Euplotes crassus TaxID=5936 RepID=A0AAD1UHV5_EUPCR|nr:unnamed protein product [Moneuplotes crassus]